MNFWDSLSGEVEVQITSAAPERILSELNSCGIYLQDVVHIDELNVRVRLRRKDSRKAGELAQRRSAELVILKKKGLYWNVVGMAGRPVLLAGLLILLFLTLFLPTRILFVTVTGNERLPDNLILENAAASGIEFGASRAEVRSEATKNKLLAMVPELRWAGVNTYGCVAVIKVQEKHSTQETQPSSGIGHIVASKDGIVAGITVLRGAVQCKVGQAVQKGEVLVSGYIDHGLTIEGTQAEAEISGLTGNVLYMYTLAEGARRELITETETRFSLLLGKKLINFGKDSGISDAGCVRMYEERYLTLPGGFQLPVALVCEQFIYYTTAPYCERDPDAFSWMQAAAETYLRSQMLSGEILSSNTLIELDSGACRLYGTYRCREIIGCIRSEEKLNTNEQRN